MKEVKGVMHLRSAHSGGQTVGLAVWREQLIAQGFSFACVTEAADTLTSGSARSFISECNALSDDRFLFIPGFTVPYCNTQVLMIGARKFISQTADDIEDVLAWREVTPVMVLAHPARNQFRVDDTLRDLIDGVEVWNAAYDGERVLRPRSVGFLTDVRTHHEMIATAGLDSQRIEYFGGPYITMHLTELDEHDIVDKLSLGEFWFGNGVYRFSASEPLLSAITWRMKVESALSVVMILAGTMIKKIFAWFGFAGSHSMPSVARVGV